VAKQFHESLNSRESISCCDKELPMTLPMTGWSLPPYGPALLNCEASGALPATRFRFVEWDWITGRGCGYIRISNTVRYLDLLDDP
jgi:hypothetical protein